jgi:hypothetical protein
MSQGWMSQGWMSQGWMSQGWMSQGWMSQGWMRVIAGSGFALFFRAHQSVFLRARERSYMRMNKLGVGFLVRRIREKCSPPCSHRIGAALKTPRGAAEWLLSQTG